MLYSEKVMDHFENPRNLGVIEDADGIGEVGNPRCGDIMKMYIKVENDVITDIKFKTYGCGSAVASSSMATEMIKGKTIEEALQLSNKAVAEALGACLPTSSTALFCRRGGQSRRQDYYDKNGIEYNKKISATTTAPPAMSTMFAKTEKHKAANINNR